MDEVKEMARVLTVRDWLVFKSRAKHLARAERMVREPVACPFMLTGHQVPPAEDGQSESCNDRKHCGGAGDLVVETRAGSAEALVALETRVVCEAARVATEGATK